MTNRVTEVLEIEKPVIQGAMAFTSLSPLVGAVSNAGGLGVLGTAFMPKEATIKEIKKTRELTSKPFGVNIAMTPGIVEIGNEVVNETKPPVIYADAFDLDKKICQKYFPMWKKLGCKIIVKASFIKDAITAEETGADVVIVKGWEGGGHISYESTLTLLTEATERISIPVVAAGGITNGKSAAAAFIMGAEGVELGSSFLVSKELPINERAKKAILDAGDMSTVEVAYASGNPFRMLKNNLSDKIKKMEAENTKKVAAEKEKGLDAKAIKMGMYQGDAENGSIMVGQAISTLKEERPVKDIIDSLLRDTKETLSKADKIEL